MPNKQTADIGKGRKGPGRPKGSQNKITRDVKDMILAALDKAGGVNYLTRQATESPAAFMTLLGKVLPTQLTGADGKDLPAPQFIVQPVAPKADE